MRTNFLIAAMDKNAFEQWMEKVLPQMAALSAEQTEVFLQQFIHRCSIEQKYFLEKEFIFLLKQDLLALPDLVLENIMEYLSLSDLLTLRLILMEERFFTISSSLKLHGCSSQRATVVSWHHEHAVIQVCQSWNKKITTLSWLWTSRCRQLPVAVDEVGFRSGRCSFQFFMQCKRALHAMATGEAYHTECSTVLGVRGHCVECTRRSPTNKPHVLAYNHDARLIVMGSLDGQLTAVESMTHYARWPSMGTICPCLYMSSELLLAGNHFGQVRVLSLDGCFLRDFQCGASAVTALDVHPSGRFMITATSDGLLHLADENLEVYSVALEFDSSESSSCVVTKVLFLPDSSLNANQVAVCVCIDFEVLAVVLTETGKVVNKTIHKSSRKMFSVCQSSTEHGVLYTVSDSSSSAAERWLTKHSFHVSQCALSSQVKEVVIGIQQPVSSLFNRTRENMLLVAAGRQLGIAVVSNTVYVFRMDSGVVVSALPPYFLEGECVMGLVHRRETGRILAMNGEWLDGLSPSTMRSSQPFLLFGYNSSDRLFKAEEARFDKGCNPYHSINRLAIKSLCWAPDLWESFGDGTEGKPSDDSDGDAPVTATSHAAHRDNRREESQDSSSDLDRREGKSSPTKTLQYFRTGESLGTWRDVNVFKQVIAGK